MPRGGYREGAGGKPSWKHGKTKPVRVPISIANKVIEIARILDSMGAEDINSPELLDRIRRPKLLNLSGLPIRALKDGPAVYLSDLVAAGYEIDPPQLVRNLKQRSTLSSLKSQVGEAIERLKHLEDDGL